MAVASVQDVVAPSAAPVEIVSTTDSRLSSSLLGEGRAAASSLTRTDKMSRGEKAFRAGSWKPANQSDR